MWCSVCSIRLCNIPITYIYCAWCLGIYNTMMGIPIDWTWLDGKANEGKAESER